MESCQFSAGYPSFAGLTKNQKQKMGPALRTAAFCGTYFAAWQYDGIQGCISDTRGGSKQIISGLWPGVTPNDGRQKWKLNRRGSVGRWCHRYSACFALESHHWIKGLFLPFFSAVCAEKSHHLNLDPLVSSSLLFFLFFKFLYNEIKLG